jgi:hypothetical protein
VLGYADHGVRDKVLLRMRASELMLMVQLLLEDEVRVTFEHNEVVLLLGESLAVC